MQANDAESKTGISTSSDPDLKQAVFGRILQIAAAAAILSVSVIAFRKLIIRK